MTVKKVEDYYKRLKLICVIVSFMLTWFVNEEWIFQKFFTTNLNIAFSGINSVLEGKKLGRDEVGFNEVLTILEPKTDTGNIMFIQWGGSMLTTGRGNQSFNTYWLIGTNEIGDTDKKLGEITYNDDAIENKIYMKYKAPIVIPIKNGKIILMFLIGFYGVFIEIESFLKRPTTIKSKTKKRA